MARVIAVVAAVLCATVGVAEALFLDTQLAAACNGKKAGEPGVPIKDIDVSRDGQTAPAYVAPAKADYDVLCIKPGSLQTGAKGRVSKCKLQGIVDVNNNAIEVTLASDSDAVHKFQMMSNKEGKTGKKLSCEFHCGTTTTATIDDCTLVK